MLASISHYVSGALDGCTATHLIQLYFCNAFEPLDYYILQELVTAVLRGSVLHWIGHSVISRIKRVVFLVSFSEALVGASGAPTIRSWD